ncbi:nucleotidyltransferase family protein (plasmid) [Azospirillum sp. HJ39]|uniref:nucleotidyltransferase family protein n=1 Tax=Azospirillum sp. HJ39 TaxID=3159496 RepID=UPI003556F14E
MIDLDALLINETADIGAAMMCIDRTALQIALVTDDRRRLRGTVTDGDIRRALLNGMTMSTPVRDIMSSAPHKAQAGVPPSTLLRQMRRQKIRQIPLVDAEDRVVGLCTIDMLLQWDRNTSPVVLMAGGLGTRLHPLTATTPKPMLVVGGKPLLETIIESFVNQGFYRFYISLNYRGDMIRDYFAGGTGWGAEITYLEEDRRLGTAGGLALLPERPRQPLLVMNGDILTSIDFRKLLDFHRSSGAAATMALREHKQQIPYGVAEVDGGCLREIREKPEQSFLINAGIYVLEPSVLDLIPHSSPLDMPDLFRALMSAGEKVGAFRIEEYWLDIGSPSDLQRAENEFPAVFR